MVRGSVPVASTQWPPLLRGSRKQERRACLRLRRPSSGKANDSGPRLPAVRTAERCRCPNAGYARRARTCRRNSARRPSDNDARTPFQRPSGLVGQCPGAHTSGFARRRGAPRGITERFADGVRRSPETPARRDTSISAGGIDRRRSAATPPVRLDGTDASGMAGRCLYSARRSDGTYASGR